MIENRSDGWAEVYYSEGDGDRYVTAGVLVRDLTPERAEDFLARCRRAVEARWAQRRAEADG